MILPYFLFEKYLIKKWINYKNLFYGFWPFAFYLLLKRNKHFYTTQIALLYLVSLYYSNGHSHYIFDNNELIF